MFPPTISLSGSSTGFLKTDFMTIEHTLKVDPKILNKIFPVKFPQFWDNYL